MRIFTLLLFRLRAISYQISKYCKGLDYKKVINDYLGKLVEEVKKSIGVHWQNLDFYSQVLIVLTVTEFNF